MRYGDGIVMIGNEIVECEVGCDSCDSEDRRYAIVVLPDYT